MKRKLLSIFVTLTLLWLFPLTASADSLGQNIIFLDADTMEAINPYGNIDNLNLTFERPDGTSFQCEGRQLDETDWVIYFDTFSYFTSAGLYTLKSYPIPRGYDVVEIYSEDWDGHDSSGNLITKKVKNGFIVSEITTWSETSFGVSLLSNTINILVRKTEVSTATNAATPVIISQPADILVNQGAAATLRINATVSKGTLSYQWYSRGNSGNTEGSLIRGATSPTYSPPTEGSVVLYYYCVITNTDSSATGNKISSVTSNAAKVTVENTRREIDFYVTTENKTVSVVTDWDNNWLSENATAYNHDMAIASLILSSAAYDELRIKNTLPKFGFSEKIKTVYNHEWHELHRVAFTYAYNSRNNTIAIVLRGTEGNSEWTSNIFYSDWGFNEAAKRVLETIEADTNFKALLNNGTKFWLSGHSRGGAVADALGTLIAAKSYGNSNNVFVYGFASPNAARYNKALYNNQFHWVNSYDDVGFVMPNVGKYGWTYYFTPDDEMRNNFKALTGKTYSVIDDYFSYIKPFDKLAHAPETYMSYLLTRKTVSTNTERGRTVVSVRCPVDVEIYDKAGVLIGRVTENTIDESIKGGIFIWLDGDEKYFMLPFEGEHTVKMTSTDEGMMEYAVSEYDGKGSVKREVVYKDVPLSKGVKYSGKIAEISDVAASSYNLMSDDGTIIKYSYISDGNQTAQDNKDSLLTASSWAKEGIKAAISKGFVPADIQNNYTNVITRAEFCRMAVMWLEYATGKNIDTISKEKMLNINQDIFSDTNDEYILIAYALGITNGTTAPSSLGPGKFTPNGQFSREQAATMVRNVCRVYGAFVDYHPSAGYADIEKASNWAVDSINFCYNNKIMTGTSVTPLLFSPQATYTREQSIVTFNNIKPENIPDAASIPPMPITNPSDSALPEPELDPVNKYMVLSVSGPMQTGGRYLLKHPDDEALEENRHIPSSFGGVGVYVYGYTKKEYPYPLNHNIKYKFAKVNYNGIIGWVYLTPGTLY